ncbi:hypothetical protein FNV43_RR08850 [Rhamnella rubrinervis]|uniref:Uncharacterized protein n=1 Tax=Rhamnella rubrinervis TaxID=2594499 RepID=A0A8K0HA07_9ROSA|nr:hypothetical protein FNV43_RR08850 [Rhamnella rubrinervis]
MAEAMAIKNSEIEALVSAIDGLKKQAAISEGNLASLQGTYRNEDDAALREELASAERRAEKEHAAHNASKMEVVDFLQGENVHLFTFDFLVLGKLKIAAIERFVRNTSI